LTCKFVLSDLVEDEIGNEDGYSNFEPTVALEIDGKNVFHVLGINGAKNTVIMHFRENAIKVTIKMIDGLDEENDEYKYWLVGTGFGFRLERNGRNLRVFLEVDKIGPTQGVRWPQTVHVGTMSVDEWVEAIVSLSAALSETFRRSNPSIFDDQIVRRQEAKISRMGEWLRSAQRI